MDKGHHWKTALPTYLRISLLYFATISVAPLAIVLVSTLWTRFTTKHWAVSHTGVGVALIFGGIFFLLALGSAVGYDIHRNWKATKPTVAWNPLLLWKVFLYLGAVFFSVAALLAYPQGAWLSVEFLAFAVGPQLLPGSASKDHGAIETLPITANPLRRSLEP